MRLPVVIVSGADRNLFVGNLQDSDCQYVKIVYLKHYSINRAWINEGVLLYWVALDKNLSLRSFKNINRKHVYCCKEKKHNNINYWKRGLHWITINYEMFCEWSSNVDIHSYLLYACRRHGSLCMVLTVMRNIYHTSTDCERTMSP